MLRASAHAGALLRALRAGAACSENEKGEEREAGILYERLYPKVKIVSEFSVSKWTHCLSEPI